MFHKPSNAAAYISWVVAQALLVGCSGCNSPTEIESNSVMAGVYVPDKGTQETLHKLGFDRPPRIVISESGKLKMISMPTIWRNWNGDAPTEYEDVIGEINIAQVPEPMLLLDVVEVNEKAMTFTFAGTEVCKEANKFYFRIPYKGWDQGSYLIFKRNET